MPLTIKVQGHDVMVVEEVVYLGSLIHSITRSTCDISCDAELRKSDLEVTSRQLNEVLYGSDCWVISKTDARKINALDQWCLHMLLGIKWYQFVRNDDVRRPTKQPKLTAVIQSHRLTLFGHIMRMDKKQKLPLLQTGEENQVVPASRGSALSNRI